MQTPNDQLKDEVTRYLQDPYGFVMWAFPWGESGTSLANETGPDAWQERILKDIGHALTHGFVMNEGNRVECDTGIYIAVRSGHGIGKSALMAMIEIWFQSTHPNPQSVTTANTKEQLSSKTWRELAKWVKIAINRSWFKVTATKIICMADPSTWFGTSIPWSKENPEAFAGTHERYVTLKFDEASAIPDIIWEVSEGAMTESHGLKVWIVFGNPTRNTGRFSECFKKFRHRWITYEVDARTSPRVDQKKIKQWEEDYGEDSDFFRVRVTGKEPRSGILQFIGNDIAEAAKGRKIHVSAYIDRPKILGVDIARGGDDQTVFIKRQGLAAYGLEKYRIRKTQTIAGHIAATIDKWDPDAVFLDMGNIGAAAYDLLKEWGYDVTGIWFAVPSDDKERVYANKRIEMWGKMRDWLENGGCYPDDNELRDDMVGPEMGYDSKDRMLLESKKDMKERGLASPDCGDALALTFAHPVAHRTHKLKRRQSSVAKVEYELFAKQGLLQPGQEKQAIMDYDLFGYDK